jgi:hypothetical protein
MPIFNLSFLNWFRGGPSGTDARRGRRYVPDLGLCEPRPLTSGLAPADTIVVATPTPTDQGVVDSPDDSTDSAGTDSGDNPSPDDGPSTSTPTPVDPLLGTVSWG